MHRAPGMTFLLAVFVLLLPTLAIADGSLTVSWNPNSESDLAGYKVYYGDRSGNYPTVINVGNVTTYTVSNLQGGVTYYFVVTAYDNSGNESSYSLEVSATLPSSDTTPPTISAVAAANLTLNAATITWTTNEAADTQVEYGFDANYGNATALNSQLLTAHSVIVSGLNANTTYHYRVKSRDAAGNLATSGDFTFTTLGVDATPPLISNIAISNISDINATISWTTNEPSDNQVEYGQTIAYGLSTAVSQNLTTNHRVVISGLSASSLYHFRVKNRDGAGNLAVSADRTFTTTAQSNFVRRVNAGGPDYTDVSGNSWSSDQPYSAGSWGYEGGDTVSKSDPISNTEDDPLYQTERWGFNAYRFDVPVSGKYRVLLLLAEIVYQVPGKRIFDVRIENQLVINDLDLVAAVGHDVATSYTFEVDVSDGRLDVDFIPVVENTKISAIEVSALTPVSNDVTPPSAISATLSGRNSLTVIFSEPVSGASAQNVTNYTISPAVSVTSANLQSDQRTVVLTTANHTSGQNYTLTVRNISDLASPPNVMTSPATFNYTYQATDVTPPSAISATAISRNTVNVLFSEAVSIASSQNKANYGISPAIQIIGATLLADQRTVQLTTGNHTSGQSYTLMVRNINDLASPPNVMAAAAALNYTYQATDLTPPTVLNATIINQNALSVLFSEPVSVASAQSKTNYTINPSVTIMNAVLQSDSRTVVLATENHTDGVTYTLTVRNVSDRAPTPNIMPTAANLIYTYQAEDTTPPRIASVNIDSPTHLIVAFSEKVTVESAQALGNYRISDGVTVTNATLVDNGIEVELTTSQHQYDHEYVLAVSNVRDRSPAGNVIAANSTIQYFLAGNGNGNGNSDGGLLVNSLSLGNYQVDSLRVGDTYYVDRSYRINYIPPNKRRALWIKTANSDKANSTTNFLEFNLNREADIYVAYDTRATSVPAWLSHDFDKTNEYIGVSETGGRLDLWRGHFLPGRVTLGGNLAPSAANVNSMYVVLIDDLRNPPGANQEVPRSFVLYQNYPNPFNPRTEISFYIEKDSYVVINIHNSLGQVVRTLYEGRQSSGNHRLTWDARNERGQLVPSGTYIYTLEVREQLESGGFTLTTAVSRQSRAMTLLK